MVRNLEGAQILIVDDEPDNLSLLQILFNHHHAVVTIANSGEQCEAMLRERSFDLVLLDIRMPKVSGEQVIAYIRNELPPERRAILTIAVTSHAMSGDRERIMALGFDYYLPKPLDVQEVLQVVIGLLNR